MVRSVTRVRCPGISPPLQWLNALGVGMRVSALLLAALCLASAAHARSPKKHKKTAPPPVTIEVPAEKELDPDAPAVEPGEEDLWSWVSRLEGEDPSPEARQMLKERSEQHFSELGLVENIGPSAVPVEFYQDPAKALAVDPLYLDLVDPKEFDIPITVNEQVAKWVRYFTGPGRKYYERYLSRSTRYRPMMYRQLEEQGLPRDLVYLSMIESGYSPHAYSAADAAGLWQFIPSTARMYRMRVDFWVDDRRDPERSTQAGLEFLKDLHGMFGDWYLAWASYNTGPGRVKKATVKGGTTDFWKLSEANYFLPETENYVPKIIAAAIIGKHPERYGFTGIDYQEELTYDKTKIDGAVDLEVLAKCAGISVEDFQALNPALRRFSTPAEGVEIRLPVGTHDDFIAQLASVPKSERLAVTDHRVRRGETLSSIAKKYGVSTRDLVRANRLKNSNRIVVGMTLVIPGKGGAVARADEPEEKPKKSAASDTQVAALDEPRATDATPASEPAPIKKSKYHTVKSGETLSKIAEKYKVSISKLRSWNSLKGDKILVGQKLKVRQGEAPAAEEPVAEAPAPKAAPKAESGGKTSYYTGKRGDALSAIAAKYGVSMSDIQKWNKIKNPSDIQAGQKLKILEEDSGWTTYKVKAGDSLGAIATRNGCSVDQLKSWNNLSSSVIQPGQVLQVKK